MSLADEVGGSFAATGQRLGVKAATLIVVTPGTRTVGLPSSGTNPTTASHACKGFVSSFDARRINGTLVKADDRMISLFATTLASGVVPKTGDRVTIEGVTFHVVSVARDPASVMYQCHGRR